MDNKRTVIIVLIILVIGLFGFGYYYFTQRFSLTGDCNNEQIASSTSPNSQYTAYHFVRDCGATTDFVTHVEIRSAKLEESESVLVFNGKVTQGVKLTWLNDSVLKIDFDGNTEKIFKFADRFKDVNVQLVNNGSQVTPR